MPAARATAHGRLRGLSPHAEPAQSEHRSAADRLPDVTTVDQEPSGVLASSLAAAMGRHHREDPVLPGTGGPAGNVILTAWTGLVLLALSVAELLTLFDVRGLISWHVAIGALLIPPALLKTGTTTWRMVQYYRGNGAYQQAGPPPLLLRLLGPAVVLSTLGLLATGVLLVLLGEQTSRTVLVTLPLVRVDWLFLHQATFAVWATVTGLHLLGRLVPALQIVARNRQRLRMPGRVGRSLAAATVIVVAVLLAVLLAQSVSDWDSGRLPFHPEGTPAHPLAL